MLKKINNFFFVLNLFAACLCLPANSQTNEISRLKKIIQLSQTETIRLQAILSLCDQGNNLHPDTLMEYARHAESIATRIGDLNAEIRAKYFQSFAMTNKGLIDSSLNLANECLSVMEKKPDLVLRAKINNQKGRCFMRKNQYKEAIEMGYEVITGGEKANDTLLQMQGKTLIGWANLEMGRLEDALTWHLKALYTTKDEEFRSKYSILFANLALNYNGLGKTDSAFYYIEKAISYSRKNENLFALSNSLAIQAQLYVRSGQTDKAAEPLEETVRIRKLIGDPFYIVSDMAQLGLYYAHSGQPQKGIAISNEGIAIARQYHIDTKLFFLWNTLAENYKAMGDNARYAETLEKIIELKDSVYQENSALELAEMQARYELQKKETTIMQQKLNITRKNYLFFGSILLILTLLAGAILIFMNYRKRHRMNVEKIMEDEKRNTAEAIKTAEEKERRRIAADLHDNLGAYAASMASNLDYIEMKGLPGQNKDLFRALRSNSQAIVSQLNDTIWVLKKDSLSLTEISDRIKVFINRILPNYPGYSIEVNEQIDNDRRLSPSQAFHLYRIMQEALINALKHSNGNMIILSIKSADTWNMEVSDNGQGIKQPGKKDFGGNGINNIKHRCQEAGWTAEWLSNEKGTSLLVAPTTN